MPTTLTTGPRVHADKLTYGDIVLVPAGQTHGGGKVWIDDVKPGPYLDTIRVWGRRVLTGTDFFVDGTTAPVATLDDKIITVVLTTTVRRSTWRITDTPASPAQEK